jgi:TM2 domain-containing membrane protein YozV
MQLTKHDLSVNELMVLNSELRDSEKSLGIAYLMLIGGHWGIHRFYLKRKKTAFGQLALFLFAGLFYILAAVSGVFENNTFVILCFLLTALAALALAIWIIVDLFLLPGMVKAWNSQVEQQLISRITQFRNQQQS